MLNDCNHAKTIEPADKNVYDKTGENKSINTKSGHVKEKIKPKMQGCGLFLCFRKCK